MADIFSVADRSRVMAAIKGRGNKQTELRLARMLKTARITGWRRHQRLPGRPDFVFRPERVAVFVDGCFWHGCPKHGRTPTSNSVYWLPKLARNKARDRQVTQELRKSGWKVLRYWDHDLRHAAKVIRRLLVELGRASTLQVPHELPVRKRAVEAGSMEK
jgi:DNA mismatch endonuclease (patch repair protein)